MTIEVFAIGIVVAITLIAFSVLRMARRKLGTKHVQQLHREWAHVLTINDSSRRVLEAEKVLDHAFHLLRYTGTFGEKLRKAERLLSNYQPLWDAHKLRNKIAHEPGFIVSDKDAERAVRQFEKALNSLY